MKPVKPLEPRKGTISSEKFDGIPARTAIDMVTYEVYTGERVEVLAEIESDRYASGIALVCRLVDGDLVILDSNWIKYDSE